MGHLTHFVAEKKLLRPPLIFWYIPSFDPLVVPVFDLLIVPVFDFLIVAVVDRLVLPVFDVLAVLTFSAACMFCSFWGTVDSTGRVGGRGGRQRRSLEP
jgi:hypothetical protein